VSATFSRITIINGTIIVIIALSVVTGGTNGVFADIANSASVVGGTRHAVWRGVAFSGGNVTVIVGTDVTITAIFSGT
jgi:hypothetical protein